MKLNLKHGNLPNHIAIILDGNGRWAKNRNLSRTEGHKAGVENLEMLIDQCKDLNIKYITLYVFSTENWKRPAFEVNNLMLLLNKYLTERLDDLMQKNIRLNVIGDVSKLPKKTMKLIAFVINETKNNSKMVLTLAINYGARNEILRAVKNLAEDAKNSKLDIDDIDEKLFSKYLYTYDIPDPDLLIRTSGEYRLSNFLLWQCAYTEFWYTDVFWPDFKKSDLYDALESFKKRKRRFGKVDDGN
ncbi:undecaprenyl diphosphate synthase [Candidatus Arthromitus sp. SFB-mouse-Japan]|uniref:isoprenyl transferase n=1 Tax=unclassified Candidatus Neoarthromitus TaxID=2638829 RepID=UPI00021B7C64|nr:MULTISPECIES: isoprenyl transferase [unclassified Candidatus Arthromitus]EIA28444.1 Undecaprenyl diphosphate synthase [Candidatus Arthromitus sp. SFB-co]EIA30778.1 Undecaprenyl diphosphate synthase [Candidatus Arthromitus sp. SFB-mouse-SU]AID44678.1 Undecaprenyl diphosphate synthase [Candidatus Arthromitus sp. SFB-mouse-NL]EGX28819.1 di-trans,poly-cis-decaprenylcistransferase [Candidatus Arthromitus sp. SFB-mouse-NYU]BAK56494.1 undecaprenyl diphosphate synthase [Candidatus Arthromitus sp. S